MKTLAIMITTIVFIAILYVFGEHVRTGQCQQMYGHEWKSSGNLRTFCVDNNGNWGGIL